MASLDQLMLSASTAMKQVGEAQIAIQANTAALETSAAQTAGRYESIADSAELMARTIGLGKLASEQSNMQTALNVGADPKDIMGRQAQDAQILLQAQDARATALQKINEKKAVSFFDDPIGWFTAQFTINDDIAEYNAANDQAANVEATISERAKFVDAQYQNNLRTTQTVTAASVDASASQARNLALVQADEARRQAILYNSTGVKELVSLSVQQMQLVSNAVDAQTRQEQLQIALGHLDLSRQEFDWKTIEKSKGDKASQYVVDMINRGLEIIDPNEPALDINSPKAIALISGKLPLSGKLQRAFELGEMNSRVDPDGQRGTRILGSSPVDFLQTLQYKPAIAPDQKAGVNLVQTTVAQAQDTAQYKALLAAKDVEGAKKFLNEAVKEAFKQASNLVSSPDNPYALPTIETILSNTPALSELPFVQKVLSPAIAAKIPLADASKIYALGIAAVSKGDISLNQMAVDMSVIYRQAQRINIQSKQLIGMGIAPLEAYNVKIQNGDLIDPKVNLADPNELRRLIARDMSSQAFARRRLLD